MTLIDQFIKQGYLKTSSIIDAFHKIKRKDFLSSGTDDEAEENRPIAIGCGQTISQPLTVAFMLELCQPKKGDRVLDVGSGSGWTTALLAEIVGPGGKVCAIERIQELKDFGEKNAEKYHFVSSGRAIFVCGDGSKGLPNDAPYDVIHVGAAAARIPPELLKQLVVGGRLVIPEGVASQEMVLVERTGPNEYKEQRFPGFIFVPLISEEKQTDA